MPERQIVGDGRRHFGLPTIHQQRQRHPSSHHPQCQQVLLRQVHPSPGGNRRLILGEHRLVQHLARDPVDRSRPAARLDLNLLQLAILEQLQSLPGTLEALGKIGARFLERVRLQLLHMAALGLAQRLQTLQQLGLGKQEDMSTSITISRGQRGQGFQRLVLQFLGVIHQQLDFLAGLIQAGNLTEQPIDILTAATEPLTETTQQRSAVARLTG
ncbi:hypothetical protein D9M71_313150 [compost metagenome]